MSLSITKSVMCRQARFLPNREKNQKRLFGTLAGVVTRQKHKGAARPAGPLFVSEWMEELGVGDAELGERLGVSATTVWRWRQSPTRLNPLKQAKVAKALGIWPGQLWMHPKAKAMRMIRIVLDETPE